MVSLLLQGLSGNEEATGLFPARSCATRLARCVCCIFIYALLGISMSCVSRAQVLDNTTMTPTPGSGHDYIQSLVETINPANGSLSIRIAAPAPLERGINLPLYAYTYDSNGYYQWEPVAAYPSGYSQGVLGRVLQALPYKNVPAGGESGGNDLTLNRGSSGNWRGTIYSQAITNPPRTCTYGNDYFYVDASMGVHDLGLYYFPSDADNDITCTALGVSTNSIDVDGDSSITGAINTSLPSVPYVYDLHGTLLNSMSNIEDTNGNYLDGTGRPYAQVRVDSHQDTHRLSSLTVPGLTVPYTYSYPTLTGPPPATPFSPNAILSPKSSQGCPVSFTANPSVNSAQGNTIILLPDGLSYAVSFDGNYGLPNLIRYPNGATVSYIWGNNTQSDSASYVVGTSGCSYKFDSPAIKSRKPGGLESVRVILLPGLR